MKNKNKAFIFRILSVGLAILMLVSVRLMEKEWFPEPLIDFFGSSRYLTDALPELRFQDFFNHVLRYTVNSLLSILILYLLFNDRTLIRLLTKIYLIAGIALLFLFTGAVLLYEPGNYRLLFYIRRLLIQPVFLFFLIPVIFYVKSQKIN